MQQAVNLWPLLGILAIIIGFLLRLNAVLVVIIAGIITGVGAPNPAPPKKQKKG
jgi:uncharacterized membrane protein